MNFSEDQLKEIEDMAGLFFGAEDIAINLELTEEETEAFGFQIDSRNTSFPQVAAYLKGCIAPQKIGAWRDWSKKLVPHPYFHG